MLLLYILLAILAVLVLLIFMAPKKYDVRRRIVINRPLPVVFDYIKYIENQNHWSPWQRRDPDMIQTQSGSDGTVGYIKRWESDHKEVGTGEQEIKAIVENQRIDSELRFYKPWKSKSNGYFIVQELAPGQTEVIWGFEGKHKVPVNAMMMFYNMDNAVGYDFEEGLSELKRILEDPQQVDKKSEKIIL